MSSSFAKTPCTIVTGFFGAGKTTLVRNLIETAFGWWFVFFVFVFGVFGFVGAGKTTLVRNLIETANGRRLAIIVNEFGDIGIDGDILKSCGVPDCPEDRIVELSNGCICCTVADDFVPALKRLQEQKEQPENIVIETTGLALTK